jgi:hypothetical protein
VKFTKKECPKKSGYLTGSRGLPVRVQVNHGKGAPGSNQILFELKALDDESLHVTEKAVFLVPR